MTTADQRFPSKQTRYTGTVESIVNGGWGIIRQNRKVVFLNYVLPGEEVSYRIRDVAKGVFWGETEEILAPAAQRVSPPCPYFGTCGGCIFQHIDYPHQLSVKKEIFKNDLSRIASLELEPERIYESSPFAYRIRARVKSTDKGKIGFIKKGTHAVYPVESCMLYPDAISRYYGEWNRLSEPPFFFQQDLLLETAGGQEKIHAYLSHAPTSGQERILRDFPNVQFSWKQRPAAKPVHIEVPPFSYQASPSTFFQVNKFQFKPMLDFVETHLYPVKRAVDLYSGVGFFIPLLLKYADKVTAVENSAESTQLARQSFPDAEIVTIDADRMTMPKGDLIIADPPRSGFSKNVIRSIIEHKFKRLIYISCSTASFSRDLKRLIENGYELSSLALFDLFPQTAHIETIAVLDR